MQRILAIGVALLVIPQNGLLRDAEGTIGPFINSLVILIMLFFLFPGVAYGWVAGTCRTSRQFSTMTGDAMGTMGGYIVLAFAAAQFVAYFKWTNLGLITAVKGAEMLRAFIELVGAENPKIQAHRNPVIWPTLGMA